VLGRILTKCAIIIGLILSNRYIPTMHNLETVLKTPIRVINGLNSRWQEFQRETTPIPPMLDYIWPRERPSETLGCDLSDKDLFRSYLYLDRVKETSYLGGLSGEFSKHFHQYRLVNLGLEAGVMEWKMAREILYDALESPKPDHLTDIYIFWMETLAKYSEKEKLSGGSVAGMEAWSDRITLERKILQSIASEKRPTLRAFFTALFISSKPSLSKQEITNLLSSETANLLAVLPQPVDFARVYQRGDNKETFGLKQDPRRYEPHGNDLYWIMTFAKIVRDNKSDKNDGVTSIVLPDIDWYLLQVLQTYDPALGDPYMTGRLLQFSRNDFVGIKLRTYFRKRITSSIESFGLGFNGQNTLIEALATNEVELGNLKRGYLLMGKIQEETSILHVASSFMEAETLSGDPAIIEQLYSQILAPLVAKKWNHDVEEIKRGRSRFAEHERHMWLLQWVLSGIHIAENENNYSILKRDDVIQYIRRGSIDTLLSMLAEACTTNPGSRRLRSAVVARISKIFDVENHQLISKKDGYVNSGDLHKAIEALFILRRKKLVASV